MKKIVIFAGTTEGRTLSEGLQAKGIAHTVCVATDYGALVMHPSQDVVVKSGRMNEEEMERFFRDSFDLVYDATHPFAVEVTENIRRASEAAGVEYVRVVRNDAGAGSASAPEEAETSNIRYFESTEDCAEALRETEGNILLTSGSKEIAKYTELSGAKDRIYARVLPSEESIRLCQNAGITGKQIIAIQGPFGLEMNKALIRQYDIRCLVTKQSGAAGGFYEKLQAACETGIDLFVIGKPKQEKGVTVEDVLRQYGAEPLLEIDLIGYGPGAEDLLTVRAANAIKHADVVFGSSRLVGAVPDKETYPYYLAKDVIGVLEEGRFRHAAILFSGDSGFFSGTEKMRKELKAWAEERKIRSEIRTCPGVSSLSYLAALSGEAYQEFPFLSLHGRSGQPGVFEHTMSEIKKQEKVFLILSGASDVQLLGRELIARKMEDCRILLGYELSYENEEYQELTPRECLDIKKSGLYAAVVKNPAPESSATSPFLMDEEFERILNTQTEDGRKGTTVPMTKEMIRHASIIRLGLHQHAVLYDVGSGSGSVSVEAALQDPSVTVYAIEMKETAADLSIRNAEKFGCRNIHVIRGTAPEAFEGLTPPTHVFIGGSGGNLKEILEAVKTDGNPVRVVINAVSLETIAEVQNYLEKAETTDLKIEQMSVSRGRELGRYHLLTADNPVMIFSFTI